MAVFSNGTEGHAWESAWCGSCRHDHGFHPGGTEEAGCPIFLEALSGETPVQWRVKEGPPFYLPPDVDCTSYEPCLEGRCSGDPQPDARASCRARIDEAAS